MRGTSPRADGYRLEGAGDYPGLTALVEALPERPPGVYGVALIVGGEPVPWGHAVRPASGGCSVHRTTDYPRPEAVTPDWIAAVLRPYARELPDGRLAWDGAAARLGVTVRTVQLWLQIDPQTDRPKRRPAGQALAALYRLALASPNCGCDAPAFRRGEVSPPSS